MSSAIFKTTGLATAALLAGAGVGLWDQAASGPAVSLYALALAGLLLAAADPRRRAVASVVLLLSSGVLLANAVAPAAPEIDLPVLDRAILSAMVAAAPAAGGAALGTAFAHLTGMVRKPGPPVSHRAALSQAGGLTRRDGASNVLR